MGWKEAIWSFSTSVQMCTDSLSSYRDKCVAVTLVFVSCRVLRRLVSRGLLLWPVEFLQLRHLSSTQTWGLSAGICWGGVWAAGWQSWFVIIIFCLCVFSWSNFHTVALLRNKRVGWSSALLFSTLTAQLNKLNRLCTPDLLLITK